MCVHSIFSFRTRLKQIERNAIVDQHSQGYKLNHHVLIIFR